MDSVSLDATAHHDAPVNGEKNSGNGGAVVNYFAASIKSLIVLFVLFLTVVSSMFTSSIVGQFEGAVSGRNPTNYGVAIQGVFLVLFYIIASHLIRIGVV
jgi:hypothetical protein